MRREIGREFRVIWDECPLLVALLCLFEFVAYNTIVSFYAANIYNVFFAFQAFPLIYGLKSVFRYADLMDKRPELRDSSDSHEESERGRS